MGTPCFYRKYFKDLQQQFQSKQESRVKTLLALKKLNEAYKHSAQEALEDSGRIFSELCVSIEKRRSLLTERFRDQEKAQLAQTAVVQEQLEQEIADLKKKQADLEKLSQTEEYIHFLQRFHLLYPKLETSDSFKSDFTINHQWSFENYTKSLIQLKEEVEAFCQQKVEEVFGKDSCELHLDPNTANNYLKLSNDDTHMKCGTISYKYPDHPERFSYWQQVLCKQSVPLRSYWEVEVDGENGVSIAVSYKDIIRKGSEKISRFGHNAQSWRLVRYSNNNYCFWHNDSKTEISKPIAKRIGVYLDQHAGTLSFYGVSDQMDLIYKVTTVFPQPLYAGFGIGTNSFAKICLQALAAKAVAAATECLK
ncbi:Tripartite motif-containing protein 16 [Bagarius yarrelli]|uniref:Tripartite motif-containing protein 16 n=1 Tax=Bagarius yarrelli TaxID=175774 RepID=A0A556U6N8_BAGYA|nr:Tripartite motif-containing protein 16 [Bagarius yarrelli]